MHSLNSRYEFTHRHAIAIPETMNSFKIAIRETSLCTCCVVLICKVSSSVNIASAERGHWRFSRPELVAHGFASNLPVINIIHYVRVKHDVCVDSRPLAVINSMHKCEHCRRGKCNLLASRWRAANDNVLAFEIEFDIIQYFFCD